MLIDPSRGSYTLIATILTSVDLAVDSPFEWDRCGTCTRCLDACPTDAFPAAHVLDANRCLSYLTIEFGGPIPPASRPFMDDWIFGCDVCQDVCPWNRKAPYAADSAFEPRPGLFWPQIGHLLEMSEDDLRLSIRGTAMKRAKVKGLLRNLMVVAGNSGVRDFLPKLRRFLTHDDEHVRSHAEWAIKRLK